MSRAFQFPIDIDDSYYAAIGEIAARWSWLEHRLSVLIREGFRFNKAAGRAVMAGMSASTLVRTVLTLTSFPDWIGDESLRAEVASFAKLVESQRERRNSFVHGIYGPEPSTPGKIYRILMRSGTQILAPEGNPVSVSELKQFAVELRRLQEQGDALSNKLKDAQRKSK